MNIKEIVCEGMDWIQLTLDGVQWRFLMSPLMDFRI
jgi:hypothetical protein